MRPLILLASLLATSCGPPEDELVDLSGLTLTSSSTNGEATFGLSPSFSETVGGEPCPVVGEVRFNDVVVDANRGGRETAGLFGQGTQCGSFSATVNGANSVDGNGTLTIDGATGVARFSSEGLVAPRRFVPVNGTEVTQGGTLVFRYEPATDDALSFPAVALNESNGQSDLPFTVRGNEVSVEFPFPAGSGELFLTALFEAPVLLCEGFLACETKSQHAEFIDVTVTVE